MKNIVLFFICLILCYSCGSDNETEPSIEFTSSVNNLTIKEINGNIDIYFTSSKDWYASCNQSWCNLSAKSGKAGDAIIKISATDNTEYDDRSATITISSGTITKTFSVTQKQKDAIIVSKSNIEINSDAQTVDVEINTNIDYTYQIADNAKDWIEYKSSRALSSHTLTFSIADNDSDYSREGIITISSGDISQTVTIAQSEKKPYISLMQKAFYIDNAGQNIEIGLRTNTDYIMVLPEEDWVKDVTSRSSSNHYHTIYIAPNNTYDQRKATIFFTNQEKGLAETVSIVQEPKGDIALQQDEYTVRYDQTNLDIYVNTNIEPTVNVDASWIKQITSRAITVNSFNFSIEKNNSYDDRKATITLSYKDITRRITVIQKGMPTTSGGIDDIPVEEW